MLYQLPVGLFTIDATLRDGFGGKPCATVRKVGDCSLITTVVVAPNGNCLCRGMVVMVMSVIAMIVCVMFMTMVNRCRVHQRRRKQWSGSAVR